MNAAPNYHPATWRLARCVSATKIPPALREWLLDAGSTTRRIKQIFGAPSEVRIIKQQWLVPHPSEAAILHLPLRTNALVREVELSCKGTVWMVARAVFPAVTLQGRRGCRLAAQLDERPLGPLLFRDTTLQRSEFELAILQPQHFEYQWAMGEKHQAENLWARRSVFWLANKPLLLTEVFFNVTSF